MHAEPPGPASVAGADPSTGATPGAPARGSEELAYDQAWEALRANNFTRAASGFARVLLLAPDSPLVEDASFWRAVALARGRRNAEAVFAFRDFVDGYARSVRAGEASAMLGWMLIDERVYDEAARRFTVATRDANPAVRKSAEAGLQALARRSTELSRQ
jgi:TolA-binding protein